MKKSQATLINVEALSEGFVSAFDVFGAYFDNELEDKIMNMDDASSLSKDLEAVGKDLRRSARKLLTNKLKYARHGKKASFRKQVYTTTATKSKQVGRPSK